MSMGHLQTVEKSIPRLEKEGRGNGTIAANLAAAIEANEQLEAGMPIISTSIDRDLVRDLSLLTAKPYIYVFKLRRGRAERRAPEAEDARHHRAVRDDPSGRAVRVRTGRAGRRRAREMLAAVSGEEPGLDVLASASTRSAYRPT